MRKIVLIILLSIFVVLSDCSVQAMNGRHDGRSPYGDYSPGPREGGYGARKEVRTADEARRILQKYFSSRSVRLGRMREKERFFEAEIRDRNNALIDVVIIDKRTGRIRSIY
ncbi:MAG: hypothetical protein AB1638_06910 [Nitrospirota bacterium]